MVADRCVTVSWAKQPANERLKESQNEWKGVSRGRLEECSQTKEKCLM